MRALYQAAASPHGIEDVGTNIVFHGVHNEGGVHGARKVQTKKGLVGSYNINPVCFMVCMLRMRGGVE